MTTIDGLAKHLNIRGGSGEPVVGRGVSELDWRDVYGAMGIGSLRPEALAVGLAVLTQDTQDVKKAKLLLTDEIVRIGVQRGWSFDSPYKRKVNAMMDDGLSRSGADDLMDHLTRLVKLRFVSGEIGMAEAVSTLERYSARVETLVVKQAIAPTEAAEILARYSQGLPGILATMIIDEMIGNDLCKKCKGSGQVTVFAGNGLPVSTPHSECNGTGKRGHSEARRAKQCCISATTWRSTWADRYDRIKNQACIWQGDFEAHLIRRC